MARTVTDAAIMLGAMEGACPTRTIAATQKCPPPPRRDYTKFLNAGGLKGARIGIPRAFFYETITPAGRRRTPRGGLNDEQKKVMDEAIAVLKQQGAIDRRSRGHPERHRHGRRRQLPRCGVVLRTDTRRAGTPTARSRSSTA